MQYDKQEGKTMKYSKPEVTKVASAVEVVRSNGQKVQPLIADSPYDLVATPNAYEADE